jgi:signal transduction histidine kinase/CheY-like chemotaxis protein
VLERVRRQLARLIPDSIVGDDERLRATVFVRAWVFGSLFAWVSAGGYLVARAWSQLVLVVPLMVTGPLTLWLLRRTGRTALLTHASLLVVTLCFGTSAVAQHPADYTSVGFLSIMPLLGCFILGPRQALVWLIVPLIYGELMLVLAENGWLLDSVDPSPLLSHSVTWVISMMLVWLFARSYDQQRTRALLRSEQADRAKSIFLATVSHEIRTPMNGVLGMTELMLEGDLPAEQREQLETIARSGRLLVSLINDVLDFTRIEAGRLSLSPAPFSLRAMANDVLALQGPLGRRRGLEIALRVADDVPATLQGDGVRLGQVLGNLLNNAIKFCERGTVSLAISTCSGTAARPRLRFEVQDTGIGIAPHVLARLFTAFEQGDSSTTRRYGGTGLGLSLSQQLVDRMGGEIRVESTVGLGSRFWFELELPVVERPTAAATPVAPRTSHDERVLVVDDNPINLKVAVGLVRKLGYQVDTAEDGRHALEAVGRQVYALVLMDCHMPEMDGFEATERIRALPGPAGRTPIVALTASGRGDDLEACRRVGMNAHLIKPVTMKALTEVVDHASTLRWP